MAIEYLEAFLIGVDTQDKGNFKLHVGFFKQGVVKEHSDVLTEKPEFVGYITSSSWKAVLEDVDQKDFVFRR